ncbi:ABC transporter ATP-binding protein [Myxococcota bacterium]|nr:ABC transporter ATP-binding protein [Myxococcota bacterium]
MREYQSGDRIIDFNDVCKAFGPKVIYRGLSLDVYAGETLTVIGGSGEGKSVMLKCLIGLLKPDSGSISAFGSDVTRMTERQLQAVRRRIGMLFQGAALFDSLTVHGNIAYPLVEQGWKDGKLIDERVAEVLELVGMPGTERMMPADLSGGMKKRVGLARAIAVHPEVILYDEPTTGLDPSNVRRIGKLIRDMQEKLQVTSIVVTHDMDSAFDVSDRFAMLYDKRIVWAGRPEDVHASHEQVVKDFIAGNIGSA